MVCQLPKRFGSPRHLHPCAATYNNALSTCRLERLTLPRWRGRLGSIRWYCDSVLSRNRSIPQKVCLVLTRPRVTDSRPLAVTPLGVTSPLFMFCCQACGVEWG